MHKIKSRKTVLGTTYFLVKDREKYETEVYNPSSVVERVTMLRQTKRDTKGPFRRVRRTSLHLESGSPSALAQDIQQVQKMTRFMATSSDTIDTAGIQDISMVEDFSRLTQGNGGMRKGYRESITEMDGMATKLKKRITGRETIIYEGQEIGLRKRSMSNFELTNLDDLFEH